MKTPPDLEAKMLRYDFYTKKYVVLKHSLENVLILVVSLREGDQLCSMK